MIIKKLSVKNVRSHEDLIIEFSDKVSVITGSNGIGKTTLLESIYITLRGSSFKGSDKDVLKHRSPWYRIDLSLGDDSIRTVSFDPSKTTGKKKFTIDDKDSYRLDPKDKYPVVLFEPDDLRLLHGSPSRRRDFIDNFISQVDPLYSSTLRKYDRALKQRNTLLKQEYVSSEDLFPWNVSLCEYGAEIIQKRLEAVNTINSQIGKYYKNIAGGKDKIDVKYSHQDTDITPQGLLKELEARFNYDVAVKHTSVGPHRHDIEFIFNDSPALSVASRGEVRTILLALKRIEVDNVVKVTSKYPIILLDDVFSELDSDRQGNIVDYFSKNQVIISSATELDQDNFKHIKL